MDTLGVLPAAGLCSRWNGTCKELLPVGENRWIIDYSIDAMKLAGVENFVLVSSPKKIASHIEHFRKDKYKDIHVNYVIQHEPTGLLGALQLGCFSFQNYESFCFSMPDTMFTEDVFLTRSIDSELCIGIFETTIPEKFGILDTLQPVHIVDKPQGLGNTIGKYIAWGTLAWGQYFNHILCNGVFENLTDLLNVYCESLPGCIQFSDIEDYDDIASWKEYQEWIKLN